MYLYLLLTLRVEVASVAHGEGEAATLAHALSYWHVQEASVSGMLGGLDDLDTIVRTLS